MTACTGLPITMMSLLLLSLSLTSLVCIHPLPPISLPLGLSFSAFPLSLLTPPLFFCFSLLLSPESNFFFFSSQSCKGFLTFSLGGHSVTSLRNKGSAQVPLEWLFYAHDLSGSHLLWQFCDSLFFVLTSFRFVFFFVSTVPFQSGFGIQTIHGVPKPSYRFGSSPYLFSSLVLSLFLVLSLALCSFLVSISVSSSLYISPLSLLSPPQFFPLSAFITCCPVLVHLTHFHSLTLPSLLAGRSNFCTKLECTALLLATALPSPLWVHLLPPTAPMCTFWCTTMTSRALPLRQRRYVLWEGEKREWEQTRDRGFFHFYFPRFASAWVALTGHVTTPLKFAESMTPIRTQSKSGKLWDSHNIWIRNK